MTLLMDPAAGIAEPSASARTMMIQQVTWEADGVLSLRLVDPSGSTLPEWTPGAHLDVILPSGLIRQYSLCGDPEDRSGYTVAVLREDDGRGGSRELHESARAGDLIGVRGPRNHFELAEADSYLLIAGGIGITPILAMARSLSRRGASWSLVYGGRSLKSMAFTSALKQLGDDHISVVPQDQLGILDLESIFAAVGPGVHVYCCGPAPLIGAVQEHCRDVLPEDALHVERFAAQASPAAPAVEVGVRAYEVELRRSGITVAVPAGATVLEGIHDVAPEVMTSCEEGYCGTCETKVLEGVPEHNDTILSAAERERGKTMMICVGRSCSSKLVLDL